MTADDIRRLGRLIVALGCVAFVAGASLVFYAAFVTGFPPRELADPLARLLAAPYTPVGIAVLGAAYLGYLRWRRIGRERREIERDGPDSESN